jgi:hypothetical protein
MAYIVSQLNRGYLDSHLEYTTELVKALRFTSYESMRMILEGHPDFEKLIYAEVK